MRVVAAMWGILIFSFTILARAQNIVPEDQIYQRAALLEQHRGEKDHIFQESRDWLRLKKNFIEN